VRNILLLLALAFTLVGAATARAITGGVDLSGTWAFSVDLDNGDHGDPTFVLKQENETLTGTYDGPLGQQKVYGTVKDNKAIFGFEATNNGVTNKANYTGTIESATKMTGTVEFSTGRKGKWTATKK
jgi:hypothetical protein